jgi:hypothetical protein
MTDRKAFHRWLRWLRKNFPLLYPCRVLLVDHGRVPGGGQGHCCVIYEDDGCPPTRFVIHIDRSLNWRETQATLWEEWAHALRMHLLHVGDVSEHDDLYGTIFNWIKREWTDEENQESQA